MPRLTRTIASQALEAEHLRGRVVIVKFFAKYCTPCERTLPEAQSLHEEHPEAVFIGVSLDERRSDLDATVRRHGLTFPIIHDRSNVVAGRFRVRELPASFIINAEGHIYWVAGPEQKPNEVAQIVESLL